MSVQFIKTKKPCVSKAFLKNNFLYNEHKGIGGLYFLIVNLICAITMLTSLQLSWDSQVVAVSSNLSYIVSINTTVHSYIANVPAFDNVNPSIPIRSGGSYIPLNDFNTMLLQSGISKDGAGICRVVWDGSSARVQIGEFTTSLGSKIRPHEQKSAIENY